MLSKDDYQESVVAAELSRAWQSSTTFSFMPGFFQLAKVTVL